MITISGECQVAVQAEQLCHDTQRLILLAMYNSLFKLNYYSNELPYSGQRVNFA
jgi:hypothetical protein